MGTWEFETTTGEGSEIVKVVYEYEKDEDGTYNENIREIWFEGRDVLGLMSLEQYKELEIEAAMRFESHKANYKYTEEYVP
jgi:hypothetical protein